jgi:hypothetical protein
MKNQIKIFGLILATLLAALVLAACGDPTATPTPKTPAESLTGISGLTVVEIDSSVFGDDIKMIPGAEAKLYVSDEDYTSLTEKAGSAILKVGYQKFEIPTGAKMSGFKFSGSSSTVSMFTKGQNADLLMTIGTIPTNTEEMIKGMNIPTTVDKSIIDKLSSQVKNRKTLVLILTTPGFMSGMMSAFSGFSTTPTPKS